MTLFYLSPDWNINFTSIEYYRKSIAIGCGITKNAKKSDLYTKYIYKHILHKNYIHSVRDERTKKYLEELGFEAINTGCPTLWSFTKEFCSKIKTEKTDEVVFTLTDYNRNIIQDKKLIDILQKNYKKLYFWIQGFDDYDYLKSLISTTEIEIIPHDLKYYEEILKKPNINYVGTRLHAGIYAMKHGIRSIIISIDNRADDMKETYNLNVISRDQIDDNLSNLINSSFKTEIRINEDNIRKWKDQFK